MTEEELIEFCWFQPENVSLDDARDWREELEAEIGRMARGQRASFHSRSDRDGPDRLELTLPIAEAVVPLVTWGDTANQVSRVRKVRYQRAIWRERHSLSHPAVVSRYRGETMSRWFVLDLEMMNEKDHAKAVAWFNDAGPLASVTFAYWRETFYAGRVKDELLNSLWELH